MRHRRHLGAAVLAVTLTGVLAGCGGDPTTDPTPTPTTSAPSTSPSATPLTPREQAIKDATAMLNRYFRVTDRILQDPKVPLTRFNSVATGIELNVVTQGYRQERAKGWKNVGRSTTSVLKVDKVELDNSDPKHGRVPTVQFEVCTDVSKTDVLDKAGKSVVPANRPDRFQTHYYVSNYRWKTDKNTGWRVAYSKDRSKPC